MRGRGVMLVAGMSMGKRRAQASQAQQQQAYQQGAQTQATKDQTATPTTQTQTKDVTAELQKLADLHNSGVLSDQEFAAAKQKLLA